MHAQVSFSVVKPKKSGQKGKERRRDDLVSSAVSLPSGLFKNCFPDALRAKKKNDRKKKTTE